jgi:hypothetical protein
MAPVLEPLVVARAYTALGCARCDACLGPIPPYVLYVTITEDEVTRHRFCARCALEAADPEIRRVGRGAGVPPNEGSDA